MKILCTADIHIGRRPSRLPAGTDCGPLSCADAWGRVVELAIRERVDLVAVSGDLVDRKNGFYEAAGPVELGLRRLTAEGITTVMVAGNHDHDVLPWLLDGLESDYVRLLGRNGQWERFTLERDGTVLHVDGWSFPSGSVRTSPLATYPFGTDKAAVLGLLHADLDQMNSPYAPVGLADLRHRPPALWLLGHVHVPRLMEEAGGASVLYPGSPQAMDPGEAGVHGVWIAEIGPGPIVTCRMIPLSSVHYDTVDVDVDGVEVESAIDRRVTDAVHARLKQVAENAGCVRYLSCRVRVTGHTPLHRRLAERLRGICEDLTLTYGDATGYVEKVEDRTAPVWDLAALAGGQDAPAVLARLISALQTGEPQTGALQERERLLRDAEQRIADLWRAKPYVPLGRLADDDGGDEDDRIDLVSALREQAALFLDELLAQKEANA